MEHHTYAKCGSKKWSTEEKHLLVTKRIEAEDLFSKYSSKQAEPWKKFKEMAKIGDYSERALRKQWLNMVQRYRVQKSNMHVTPLNKQSIAEVNEEWEFFGEIHAYMTQRTTDLHSYALKEPNVEQSSHNNVAMRGVVNDHNFGLKAMPKLTKNQEPAEAKQAPKEATVEPAGKLLQLENISKDRPVAPIVIDLSAIKRECSPADTYFDSDLEEISEPSDPVAVEVSDLSEVESLHIKSAPSDISEERANDPLPASFDTTTSESDQRRSKRKRKGKCLSERDKYYRHRRRYDHRMEVRLGGLCIVVGQLLEHFAPNMNLSPLLMNVYNNVDYNCDSSCDNDVHDDDDDDDVDVDVDIDNAE